MHGNKALSSYVYTNKQQVVRRSSPVGVNYPEFFFLVTMRNGSRNNIIHNLQHTIQFILGM